MQAEPEVHIDASTFQRPLETLAEVLAQKVKREGPKLLAAPPFVAVDLHVLIRQTMYTYTRRIRGINARGYVLHGRLDAT
jgi:hypothetical protein